MPCCAGTVPVNWLQDLPRLKVLDLSYNRFVGTVPPVTRGPFLSSTFGGNAAAGTVILSPMRPHYGICGAVPANFSAASWYLSDVNKTAMIVPIKDYMPASEPCPRPGLRIRFLPHLHFSVCPKIKDIIVALWYWLAWQKKHVFPKP